MTFRRVWERYRRSVEVTAQDVDRLRSGLPALDRPHASLARLARNDLQGEARLRARLSVSQARPRLPWRILAFAAAAAVVFVLGLAAPALLEPRDLDATLTARERTEADLTPLVSVAYVGDGRVTGTEDAPKIAWEDGTLHAEVEPDRGVALVVETPEARVEVIGTVFDVDRDVLGTRVSVTRGHVTVRCGTEPLVNLTAGDERTCLPVRAAGLLARARLLGERGADGRSILDAVDRGLALPAEDLVRDELAAVRVATLADLGRVAEARQAAAEILAAGGGVRRVEVTRLAARLTLPIEGCTPTLALLDSIPPDARVATDEIARADCLAPTDPVAARDALYAALALSPNEALSARIHARLEAL